MASNQQFQRSASSMGARDQGREKTYFEQQREALIGEIAMSFEHVLANINKLNRSLEAVTAVGNEFSSVEALWSQFEGVMATEPEDGKTSEVDGQSQSRSQGQQGQQGQHEGEGEQTKAGRS
ncbi:DASH complex subunit Dad1-domain-containing protein [Hypoxylon sp. FL1150]|nr:DASH complex subunit Dad1-domain-containing protein [Hypoxylon sp. FL1150]